MCLQETKQTLTKYRSQTVRGVHVLCSDRMFTHIIQRLSVHEILLNHVHGFENIFDLLGWPGAYTEGNRVSRAKHSEHLRVPCVSERHCSRAVRKWEYI